MIVFLREFGDGFCLELTVLLQCNKGQSILFTESFILHKKVIKKLPRVAL